MDEGKTPGSRQKRTRHVFPVSREDSAFIAGALNASVSPISDASVRNPHPRIVTTAALVVSGLLFLPIVIIAGTDEIGVGYLVLALGLLALGAFPERLGVDGLRRQRARLLVEAGFLINSWLAFAVNGPLWLIQWIPFSLLFLVPGMIAIALIIQGFVLAKG